MSISGFTYRLLLFTASLAVVLFAAACIAAFTGVSETPVNFYANIALRVLCGGVIIAFANELARLFKKG